MQLRNRRKIARSAPSANNFYYRFPTGKSPCPKVRVEGMAPTDHGIAMNQRRQLSPWAVRFGYAGLVPQLVFLLMAANGDATKWIAQAGSFAYAALIFSFLGGLWWAETLASPNPKPWQFGIAVAPSLIGLTCFMPWVWGWSWPEPYLALIGLLLALSPLVDQTMSGSYSQTSGWKVLRMRLSVGLGLTTMIISLI